MAHAYRDMWERLVANTEQDTPTGCWTWISGTRGHRNGRRPAMCVRRNGKPVKVQPSRVILDLLDELGPDDEASHLCADNWFCINPDHLVGEPQADNLARRHGRDLPIPARRTRASDDPCIYAGEPADSDIIPF